jgi:hypothetical protein
VLVNWRYRICGAGHRGHTTGFTTAVRLALDTSPSEDAMAQRSHVVTGARRQLDQRHHVTLPLVGTVTVPPPDRLVFYGVLGLLGVLEIVEWPIVLIVGAGHFLSEQHRHPTLQQMGEAAEAA